jgi:DNA-binding FadR family transcriptional regulator
MIIVDEIETWQPGSDRSERAALRQLRQPRLAEIVAASLRNDILSGRLKEGDLLPTQENLFTEFRVSLPAVREAMRILETEGLISVRRGNVGGAVVHQPTPERSAQMISMVLQTRGATLDDVSEALLSIEPGCAMLCAARTDRMTAVVPQLRATIETQRAEFDNVDQFLDAGRKFHQSLVSLCGNEPMIVVVSSLEIIWSAHQMSALGTACADEVSAKPQLAIKARRASLQAHESILAAIEAGEEEQAGAMTARHRIGTRNALDPATNRAIAANVVSETDLAAASLRQAAR